MGFGQGLSGLNAAAQNLDVIGNNIANSGTVGFKAASATFADVYASSRVGLGVQVASINQRFSVGTISSTGNQLDMAIDGAKGMFRVQDASGNVLYTRNGQFFADKDNNIVNAQGYRLTGYQTNGTDLRPIQVPVGNIPPRATDGVTVKTNLDANAKVVPSVAVNLVPDTLGKVTLTPDNGDPDVVLYYKPSSTGAYSWYDTAASTTPLVSTDPTYPNGKYTTGLAGAVNVEITSGRPDVAFGVNGTDNTAFIAGTPAVDPVAFDPTKPSTYSHSLPMSVYDSLGNAHQLTQYFVKREGTLAPEQSNWEVYYRLNGAPLEPTDAPHKLAFASSGVLSPADANLTLNIPNPGGDASPAAALAINLNYAGSTQFGGEFSPNFTQTGYATGEYAGMSISSDGGIVANYTNGETQAMGFLALADFNNLQGLQPAGGNAWVETGASGQPVVGRPGANGLATIKGQAVEESNVDMSQELVNMIIAQRTYQANAQTIKTQDQIMQTLMQMR